MALDTLHTLSQMSRYFPPFAREPLDTHHQWILTTISSYLTGDASPSSITEGPGEAEARHRLVRNHGKLMHLMRLLSLLPDTAPLTFSDRALLITRLWKLYFTDGFQGGKRCRLGELLVTQISTLLIFHRSPLWMRQTAQSSFTSPEKLKELGRALDYNLLLNEIQQRCSRNYLSSVAMSCAKRKATLASLIRLAAILHQLWDADTVGAHIVSQLPLQTNDPTSSLILYHSRLALLFVGHSFWHTAVCTGDFFKWWLPLSGVVSQSWDATLSSLLFRAVKYGWATGQPLNITCAPYRSILFQVVSSSLNLPSTQNLNVGYAKDNVSGEYTTLLSKNLSSLKKLAKIIALLLEPLDSTDNLSLDFKHSNSVAESLIGNMHLGEARIPTIWEYLEAFVATIYPLTHPSCTGKWTGPISQFIAAFVTAYTRRVARERMSSTHVVTPTVGSTSPTPTHSTKSLRLGRREDEKLIALLQPLLLQGMYSKSMNSATNYEGSLKRLCYLTPDSMLPVILEQIMAALETVTESHRVQSALRLLSQLCPLILQRSPGTLPDLLTLTLPGVDAGDPFKTVQVLTFYAVLLSQTGCYDCSDIDLYDVPLDKVSETMQRSFFPSPTDASPFVCWHNYPEYHNTTPSPTQYPTGQHKKPKRAGRAGPTDALRSTTLITRDTMKDFWSTEALRNRLSAAIIATSTLSSWAEDFLKQLLRLCSNCIKVEKNAAGVMSSIERSFGIALKFCLSLLLTNCDAEVYHRLCHIFLDWVLGNMIPDATKLAYTLTQTFSQARPEIAFPIFFPSLLARLPTGASKTTSIVSPGSTEEATILWHLGCLANILRSNSTALRPQRTEIVRIILWALHHENKKIFRMGGKCLRRTVESITTICPEPGNSLGYTHSSSHEEKIRGILRWGTVWWIDAIPLLKQANQNHSAVAGDKVNETLTSDALKLKWRLPQEDDMQFVQCLVRMVQFHMATMLKHCLSIDSLAHKTITPTQGTSGATDKHQQNSNDTTVFLPTQAFLSLIQDPKGVLFAQGSSDLDYLKSLCISVDDFNFPKSLLSQPPNKLLNRVLTLGRYLLKALSPLFPDERPREITGTPVVSPLSSSLAATVSEFLSEICLTLCRYHLGLTVPYGQTCVERITPLIELRGTEDGFLTKKVLAAMDQVLVRRWCVGGQQAQAASEGKLWTAFGSWLSSASGVHNLAEFQDSGRSAWCERLIQQWIARIDERRTSQPFAGFRKELLILTAYLGTHYYAENRMFAQDILKDAFGCHYGARTAIIHMLLREFRAQALTLSDTPQTQESPGISTTTESREALGLPNACSTASDSNPSIASAPPDLTTNAASKMTSSTHALSENDTELCYARMTGITYCLNTAAVLNRVWGTPAVAETALRAICMCFKTPIARDKLQSRLVTLAHGMLNHREELHRNDAFRSHIEQGLLTDLLKDLRSGKTDHWRFQLVATATLTTFNATPIDSLEEDYVDWLLSACNRTVYSPLLNTLSVFALALYLKHKLTLAHSVHTPRSPSHLPPFQNKSSDSSPNSCPLPPLPQAIAIRLMKAQTIESIVGALIHAHHETCRATPISYPETAYQLVVDVIRIDSTWPASRFARQSRHLSLHNCLVVWATAQMQFRLLLNAKDCITTEQFELNTISSLVHAWAANIERMLSLPAGEREHHMAACEILAGLLRACGDWRFNKDDAPSSFTTAQLTAWEILYPLVLHALQTLDQEDFGDFLDALRFATDVDITTDPTPAPLGSRAEVMDPANPLLAPFVNLALNTKQVPDTTQCIITAETVTYGKDPSKSSLEDSKSLRLFTTIFQQAGRTLSWLVLPERFIPSIPRLLEHPYKQIRRETASCIGFLLWLLSSATSAHQTSQLTSQRDALLDRLNHLLNQSATEFALFLETHAEEEVVHDLNVQRPREICGAETILLTVLTLFRYRQVQGAYQLTLAAFPLILAAVKHPEATISDLATTTLTYISLSTCGIPNAHRIGQNQPQSSTKITERSEPAPMTFATFIDKLVTLLERHATESTSWKVRSTILRLIEALCVKHRLLLYQTAHYKRLVNVCVTALTDPQTEVRRFAREAVSSLAVTLSNDECETYTKVFVDLTQQTHPHSTEIIPGPTATTTQTTTTSTPITTRTSSSDTKLMGGVLGLTALIQSAPYHVPDWLPNTITALAQYGSSRYPGPVKRHVERCLQEFLRTHQDAWHQCHAKKFSPAQIEILDMYKGRPVYIA